MLTTFVVDGYELRSSSYICLRW